MHVYFVLCCCSEVPGWVLFLLIYGLSLSSYVSSCTMAWTSNDARDFPSDVIRHVCHSNRNFGTVTCLICDDGFCKAEFLKKVSEGKGFFISRHIVVCPAHGNLSFNDAKPCDRNPSADIETQNIIKKLLILQKHLDDINNGLYQPIDGVFEQIYSEDKILEDDASSIHSYKIKKKKFGQDSQCQDCHDYLSELSYEKRLNVELMKQNDELRDHNSFLRSSVATGKKLEDDSITYSAALTSFPKRQEFSRLTVKPVKNFKGDILSIVKKQISSKTSAKVLKIDKSNNGSIHLKCNSKQDSDAILDIINNLNNETLTAEAFVRNNPQIRITNISEDLNPSELASDIITRNRLPVNSVNIVHKYKLKNSNHSVLAEVNRDAYLMIMKTRSVFIGFESCRVYDNFNVKRCKNCCGYNHSLKKCIETFKRPQACFKCSGNHVASFCNSDSKKCINCINANKYLTKKRSIDHSADDMDNCECFKSKWEQYVSNTDYPFKPEPPFKLNTTLVIR